MHDFPYFLEVFVLILNGGPLMAPSILVKLRDRLRIPNIITMLTNMTQINYDLINKLTAWLDLVSQSMSSRGEKALPSVHEECNEKNFHYAETICSTWVLSNISRKQSSVKNCSVALSSSLKFLSQFSSPKLGTKRLFYGLSNGFRNFCSPFPCILRDKVFTYSKGMFIMRVVHFWKESSDSKFCKHKFKTFISASKPCFCCCCTLRVEYGFI